MSTDGLVRIGRIGRPHGLRGGITIVPEVELDRLSPGTVVSSDDGREFVIAASSRYRDRGAVVQFVGIDSREAAEALRGTSISMPAFARPPLGGGEYWAEDLIGITAVAPDGAVLGTITAVDTGVGQDRLVVTTPGGTEVLVPFVGAFVGDPEQGRIEIRDPGGLF
ncbi:MAG: 16S rRNA processing protein RimM [Acidimicrobiia bacterium]|nr:16S rRNA processing protein RimM [Acidimicrobiia bacterium]